MLICHPRIQLTVKGTYMFDWATSFESVLSATEAHTITNYALYAIAGQFTFSLVFLLLGKWRNLTTSTPALLTSIGILGTFVGVVIGLLDFDPKHIDESIETLLDGLKTAFITSLAGMAAAIVFRMVGIVRSSLVRANNISEDTGVEPRDILNAISQQSEHLKELKLAISGGEDSSLTSQLKLLRSDANDNHRLQMKSFESFSVELWVNLNKVSEMLSKSATEQIIEALKNVIQDFNEKLTEQFGDNFKALDASVAKLVLWQTNYSEQLNEMIKQYSQGVLAITAIEASVMSINNETKSIPEAMAQLKPVLQINQHQINELSQHLEAFKEVKEKAVSAFPEIQKHVEATVEEISKSSQRASEGYQLLVDKTETVQRSFEHQIEVIQKQLESSITELIERQRQEMQNTFAELEKSVEGTAQRTEKVMEDQISKIDEALSREIGTAMSDLGGNLVGITRKFADDYSELVDAMHKVTQQAKR